MSTTQPPTERIVFWGKRHQFIQGFDPLGLQPTSVATYSYLLPGITNLTFRIRYYGFYCWLLSEFAEQELHTRPLTQNNYLRRAELIIALMMDGMAQGVPQIPGTNHAGRLRAQTAFDLMANGDHGPNTYWQGAWGAFGQYYFGPMHEMGLLARDPDKLFRCTDSADAERISGRSLATAFKANIAPEAGTLFFQRLYEGNLHKADLETLFGSFAIHQVPRDTEEWRLYVRLLKNVDHPTAPVGAQRQHRRETIELLLNEAGATEMPNPGDALWRIYAKGWPAARERGDTRALWYLYQLNELWQYAALALFNGFQTALQQETHPRVSDEFVSECAGWVCTALDRHGLPEAYRIGEALPDAIPDERELVRRIGKGHRNGPLEETMALGLLLLLRVAARNMGHKLDMHTYAQEKHVLRQGHMFDGIETVFRSEGKPLQEFVALFLLRWLVLRHPFEAIRKAGQGARSTLKFTVDDDRIRAIRAREPFPPQFTSPRLGALSNMLVDLGLLERTATGFSPGPHANAINA